PSLGDLAPQFPVAALSPDGRTLVYSVDYKGSSELWRRRLDEPEARRIEGAEEGRHPFFSPDGDWLGFWVFASGAVKRMPIGGGSARDFAKAPVLTGASWGADGSLVFAPEYNGGLMFVPAEGGPPRPLTVLDRAKGEASHVWPQGLPGGKAALFTVEIAGKPVDDARIDTVELATGVRRVVLDRGTGARCVARGHLLFGRHDALHAVPFDVRALKVTGPARPVLEGVLIFAPTGSVQADVAAGTLVYVPRYTGTSGRSLVWVDGSRQEKVAAELRPYQNAAISPDGRRIVAELNAANNDLWILDAPNGALTPLPFRGETLEPVWSPDGQHIYFGADQGGGQMNVYRLPADGSGTAERLTTSPNYQIPTSASPDGRYLLINDRKSAGGDISVLALDADAQASARPVASTPFEEYGGVFSPDGRWIAYQSNESGRFEVYAQEFPNPRGKRRISVDGGV